MTIKKVLPLSLTLAFFSANAFAAIIGMLASHAGSNVTIKGTTINGRPVIQVHIPKSPDCPINLYRDKDDSEFSSFNPGKDIQKDENGTNTLAFGVWYDRDCYLKDDKTPPKEITRNFDVYKEIFSKKVFANYKSDFNKGALKIALCLQQAAPGAYETDEICAKGVSKQDTLAGTVVYQSNFIKPPNVDLGLTSPKPVKPDFSISRDYRGPSVKAGQSFVKNPTLSADMASFVLDVKDAGDIKQWSFDNGGTRYDYYFLDGKLVKGADVKSAMKNGAQSYCGMSFLVPKNLIGISQINVKGGHSAQVYGGGGGCDFCDGNYGSDGKGQFQPNDPDLDRRNFWRSSIDVKGATDKGSDTEVQLLNLYCSTEKGNWDQNSSGTTAAVVDKHLRINNSPLLMFYSDYPPYQANP